MIAHISDLHCGGPYFEPNLLERAISEVNDLEPGHRRLLRRPDDVRLQARVPARPRIPRQASTATRSSSSPATTTRATSATSTSRSSSASATRCCARTASTVVAVDSTEPDLDHGQIGRGRYRWIEEQFAERARGLRIFVLHHHLLPVPGTGRERNIVYDAGDALECLQRAGVHLVLSGHKHVPYAWRLENLFVVNTGTVSSLRLRGNTRPCYNVDRDRGPARRRLASPPVPRAGADHPVLDRDVRVREVHGPHRGARSRHAVTRVARADRRRALRAGRAGRAAALPHEVVAARARRRHREAARRRGLRRAARRRARRGDRRASARARARPLRRAGARAASSGSRLASRVLVHGLPYAGADFRFDAAVARARSTLPSLAVVGTGKRVGKTAVTGHVARLLARDRHVVVVAMGRGGPPEPEVAAGAADGRDAARALARRPARGVRPPRDRGAGGCRDVGCRRCGGGLAGAVSISNVAEGARVAAAWTPDLVVFDGSGAALPPVAADRRVLVVGAHQDRPWPPAT